MAEIKTETTETLETRRILPLDIQFFAESGESGESGDSSGGESAEAKGDTLKDDTQLSTEALDKLVQSRADKLTAEQGKKIASLQKELDKMKREKLTDDEAKKLEIADREKAIEEKEQALLDKENRLFAIKAIKENGLDDGSDKSLELIDFVIGKDEEAITARVKAFKGLVDRFVSAEVEKTFKTNGRNPNGGNNAGGSNGEKSDIAAKLGEQAAAREKASNDILKYYYERGDK